MRRRRSRSLTRYLPFLSLALVALAGCPESKTTECGDELCPAGWNCVDFRGTKRCVLPWQEVHCQEQGLADGAPCDRGDAVGYQCQDGLCLKGTCGDGIVDSTEECDCGADAASQPAACGAPNSATTPNACRPSCRLPRCGDGILDDASGEVCDCGGDPAALPAGCGGVNSDSDPGACRTNCAPARCGDGVVDPGESCDDGNQVDGDGCGATCGSICGDGIRAAGEACDGTDFGALSCGSFGFHGGTLACDSRCAAVDTAGCTGQCGDGVHNGTEVCDGADFGGLSCATFGYDGGDLHCQSDCGGVSTVGCQGYCGDGIRGGSEQCDGADLGGLTCGDFAADGGALRCGPYCQLDVSSCLRSGWVRVGVGTTEDLHDIWIAGPGDIWVVGGAGTILHFDGQRWQAAASPTTDDIVALWGVSATDIWAATRGGDVLRYDGASWSIFAAGVAQTLVDIWAWSPTEVWVTGGSPTPVMLRFDGTTWNLERTPSDTPTAIWGSGPNDVWFAARAPAGGVLMHWLGAGTGFDSDSSTGPATNPYSLWGNGATDIYCGTDTGAIWHYDGSWSQVLYAGVPSAQVWAPDTNTIWAAGAAGAVWHHDGYSASAGNVTAGQIRAIVGRSPYDIWAVGDGGYLARYRAEGVTDHGFDQGTVFLDVAGSAPNNAWTVGFNGSWRFDGSAWNFELLPNFERPQALWGTGASAFWAAGYNNSTGVGSIYSWNGTSWAVDYTVGAVTLRGIWGSGAGDIVAVGDGGTIARHDGASWSTVGSTGTASDLAAVSGANASSVWAVGDGGVIVFYDGSGWALQRSGGPDLHGVWAASPSEVWAVGDGGTLLRFDGASWAAVDSGTGRNLRDVWGSGDGTLWIVGDRGTVRYYDGAAWSTVDTGTLANLLGVWGNASDDVWIVGEGGRRLRFRGAFPTAYGGTCDAPRTLSCGVTAYGTTSGGPSAFTSYSCATLDDTGPETYYRFDAPITGTVTVRLTPLGNVNLDLIALGATSAGACDAGACLAADQASGSSPNEITLSVVQGQTYYFVADGFQGNRGEFVLETSCVKARLCVASEVDCSDGVDEDCDGLTDAADPDC